MNKKHGGHLIMAKWGKDESFVVADLEQKSPIIKNLMKDVFVGVRFMHSYDYNKIEIAPKEIQEMFDL